MIREEEITRENLNLLSDHAKKINTSRSVWISQIIKRLHADGCTSLSEYLKALKEVGVASTSDMIFASRELSSLGLIDLHSDFSTETKKEKRLTVSNFPGVLSNQAIKLFFKGRNVKIIEQNSFIDLFEDVYNERSDYCIVPIENTVSGKLMNFYSLIANYNFKILKVCDIEHQGQDATTRYALLSSGPIAPTPEAPRQSLFELCVNSCQSLSDLLLAASECGLSPQRIDSFPNAYLKNKYSYYIVFHISEKASLSTFLAFLALNGISYTPIGIFSNVNV